MARKSSRGYSRGFPNLLLSPSTVVAELTVLFNFQILKITKQIPVHAPSKPFVNKMKCASTRLK